MTGPWIEGLRCDVCDREASGVHIGEDSANTALCSGCAGRQPTTSRVLAGEGPYPCVCGCYVEDVRGSCEDHGHPTWAVWLGWV